MNQEKFDVSIRNNSLDYCAMNSPIMVASKEDYCAIKMLQSVSDSVPVNSQVTQMVHNVVFPNCFVSVSQHCRIHLVD